MEIKLSLFPIISPRKSRKGKRGNKGEEDPEATQKEAALRTQEKIARVVIMLSKTTG